MKIQINVNERVKVKLTEKGMKLWQEAFPNDNVHLTTDFHGYIGTQLHTLMNVFGEHLFPGATLCFDPILVFEATN